MSPITTSAKAVAATDFWESLTRRRTPFLSFGVGFGALPQNAAVRAVMADLVAGRQGYADLKWRLLKMFEIGLAWRALFPHA